MPDQARFTSGTKFNAISTDRNFLFLLYRCCFGKGNMKYSVPEISTDALLINHLAKIKTSGKTSGTSLNTVIILVALLCFHFPFCFDGEHVILNIECYILLCDTGKFCINMKTCHIF